MNVLKIKFAGLMIWLSAAFLGLQPAVASSLVIGVPSWPSAQVTSHIIELLLEEKLGAEAELREGSTLGILSGLDSGEYQVHPEIWFPNLERPVESYVYEKKTVKLSGFSSIARQNICVTKETAAMTGIKKVSDLANPEIAKQFDTNSDGLGEIWIGAPNWSSTNIERVRAKSYGYDKTMSLLLMEEDVAMAGVDVAASLGKPVVFYCYSPHHVYQLHEVYILDEPVHDPESWEIVTPAEDPDWLDHSKAESAWAPSSFRIGFSAALEKDMPKVSKFLEQVVFSPTQSTWMSYQVQVEGIAPEQVAKTWIANNQDLVGNWLNKTE